MQYDMAQAVASGAALLDREWPRWRELVDVETLDCSYSGSVLGQVFGRIDAASRAEGEAAPAEYCPWQSGADYLFTPADGWAEDDMEYLALVAHGFDLPVPWKREQWHELAALWRAAI